MPGKADVQVLRCASAAVTDQRASEASHMPADAEAPQKRRRAVPLQLCASHSATLAVAVPLDKPEPSWQAEPHPKLLVVDLDQTMWPFDAALPRYGLPHREAAGTEPGVQCSGALARPFAEAVAVVREVSTGWRVGVASANACRDVCCSLLSALGLVAAELSLWEPGGPGPVPGGRGIERGLMEIHSGSKAVHLERLARASGIPFSEMLFFDDLRANVATAQRLGVAAHQVSPQMGLTRRAFSTGLAAWRAQRLSKAAMATWMRTGTLMKLGGHEAAVDSSVTAGPESAGSSAAVTGAWTAGESEDVEPTSAQLQATSEGACALSHGGGDIQSVNAPMVPITGGGLAIIELSDED
mmetsp:Transcript_159908/g.489151  ORF Transcript_159908/g.489151 Transcript_159908/m.489151 type:complete len:355 (-) Transcript_159908:294-1358(-)